MNYALAIYSAPGPNAELALAFSESLLRQGHAISRLFFYGDGVLNCADEDQNAAWRKLINGYELDAVVCIGSAHKRGVMDEASARQQGLDSFNLAPEFSIGGLGQLIDASVSADRFITFGGSADGG